MWYPCAFSPGKGSTRVIYIFNVFLRESQILFLSCCVYLSLLTAVTAMVAMVVVRVVDTAVSCDGGGGDGWWR